VKVSKEGITFPSTQWWSTGQQLRRRQKTKLQCFISRTRREYSDSNDEKLSKETSEDDRNEETESSHFLCLLYST